MSSVQQETPDLTRCGGCGQKAKKGVTLKICSGCGFEAYCSAACQGKGWSAHKAICKIKKKEKMEREKATEAARNGAAATKAALTVVVAAGWETWGPSWPL
jgi:hypothetical protein